MVPQRALRFDERMPALQRIEEKTVRRKICAASLAWYQGNYVKMPDITDESYYYGQSLVLRLEGIVWLVS